MRVLAAIVRAPERALDPRSDELTARDVTQLVAEQAAVNPTAIALIADSASWTYAELDRAQNESPLVCSLPVCRRERASA